jgi:nitrite reductase/ring-hydroxylating ferredoxin subunit
MPMPSSWIATFPAAEVAQTPRRFSHGGLGVLVALVDGQPHAVADACLHKGASLASGVCRDGVVTCPSHWWRYDLRDGSLQGTPGVALEVYPARMSNGVIEVELPEAAPAMSMREVLLAHARGEDSSDA